MTLLISACSSEESTAAATGSANNNAITSSTKTHKSTGNTAARISGTDKGSVTEDIDDNNDGLLGASGKLNITDPDAGEAAFIAETVSSSYGSITIDASGNWFYGAIKTLDAIQILNKGDRLKDRVTVRSIDGTTHDVVITIKGADEKNTVVIVTPTEPDTPADPATEPVTAPTEPAPNSPAIISGTDKGTVTEDFDSNNDGLLGASGRLNIADSDAGESAFIAETLNSSYGSITIDSVGNWFYGAKNSLASVQNLNTNETLTDRPVVRSIDGTTHTVVITIKGVDEANSAAIISGTDKGTVTEDLDSNNDGLLDASGRLNIADSDAGESAFIAETVNSSYGSITIDSVGNWSYGAINSLASVQNLNANETLTDKPVIRSIDGTTHTVIITIKGVDDAATGGAAIISGTDTGNVTEDNDPDGDNLLEVSGKLNISDSDAGEAAFIAETVNSSYGNLSIDSNGNWNYAASNAQPVIQDLTATDTLTDSLTVSSIDGTTHKVVITIKGVNEANSAAIISGTDKGTVTEDLDSNNDGLLGASGKLNISDSDAGEAAFIAETANSNYGSITIDSAGNWFYGAINTLEAIQNLNKNETLTDRPVIRSIDGTTHTVVITIKGVDDVATGSAAIISGTDTGSVTEDNDPDGDNLLEVSGKLNITDSDAGEAAFIAETVNSSYGNLNIDSNGNWNYAASNTQPAIQNLNTADALTDSLTVSSIDGTTHKVVITIKGINESNSVTADVTLSWTAPSEREDNTAISLSEIAGYKIYYGTTQGNYNNSVTVNDGTAQGYTFANLTAGTYYFVITTRDVDGRESQYSTEVVIVI